MEVRCSDETAARWSPHPAPTAATGTRNRRPRPSGHRQPHPQPPGGELVVLNGARHAPWHRLGPAVGRAKAPTRDPQRLLEQVVVDVVLRRAGRALLGVQPHAFAMPRRRAARRRADERAKIEILVGQRRPVRRRAIPRRAGPRRDELSAPRRRWRVRRLAARRCEQRSWRGGRGRRRRPVRRRRPIRQHHRCRRLAPRGVASQCSDRGWIHPRRGPWVERN